MISTFNSFQTESLYSKKPETLSTKSDVITVRPCDLLGGKFKSPLSQCLSWTSLLQNKGTELAILSLNQNLWWIFSSWLTIMKGLSASTISSVSGLTFTACLWYISYSAMNLLRSRITSGLNRMENGQYIFKIINLTAHDHQSRSLWEAIKIKKEVWLS